MRHKTPRLIVISGNSKSGKDELANHFVAKNFVRLHPLAGFKSLLEQYFGIEEGSLDTPTGKAQKVAEKNGIEVTYNDLLVGLFHFTEDLGIKLTEPYMRTVLLNSFFDYQDVVALAVRNIHEVEIIKEFAKIFDLHLVQLARHCEVPESSDYLKEMIEGSLKPFAKSVFVYQNDGTIKELQDFGDVVLQMTTPIDTVEIIPVTMGSK